MKKKWKSSNTVSKLSGVQIQWTVSVVGLDKEKAQEEELDSEAICSLKKQREYHHLLLSSGPSGMPHRPLDQVRGFVSLEYNRRGTDV
uniref:Uncharacterized protein n=1 Tax=Steinernema glaseri TaxID=37863 RepID=A0A1I7Z5Q8_9BILA